MTSEERAKAIDDLIEEYKCKPGVPGQWSLADAIEWTVDDAIADARAAGYTEAKEAAEKVARGYAYGQGSGTAIDIAEDIAALAPATTKEPT